MFTRKYQYLVAVGTQSYNNWAPCVWCGEVSKPFPLCTCRKGSTTGGSGTRDKARHEELESLTCSGVNSSMYFHWQKRMYSSLKRKIRIAYVRSISLASYTTVSGFQQPSSGMNRNEDFVTKCCQKAFWFQVGNRELPATLHISSCYRQKINTAQTWTYRSSLVL